jgi:hypothetical protein
VPLGTPNGQKLQPDKQNGPCGKGSYIGVETTPAITVNDKTLFNDQSGDIKKDKRGNLFKKPFKLNGIKFLSAIIFLAVLIVLMLTLPGLLKDRFNLSTMTTNVSVMNENGEREIRKVY